MLRTHVRPALSRTLTRLRPLGHSLRTAATGRWARLTLVVLVGLGAGYIGLVLGGRAETPVGPTEVQLTLHPAWSGGTRIELPPLGALELDTHWGPVALEATVTDLRTDEARKLIESDTEIDHVTDRIAADLWHGVVVLLIRAGLIALAASFLGSLALFRSLRRAVLGLSSGAVGLVAVTLVAWLSFNPQSVAEPRYTGLLSNAPQVVGDARGVVERFSAYRTQLARLVSNVSELYTTTSQLPTYQPDPSTLRVLHVSDIHINPTAWNIIKSVSTQFKVDLIIDSGDLMDHGSKPEDRFADEISELGVPYVYVRGNHDSKGTQQAVARQKNAIVLDDETREVKGLRIYGVGDPRFTPDKSTRDDYVGADQLRAQGLLLAEKLRGTGNVPDIAVAHDPNEAAAFSGLTPLILAGHTHTRSTKLLPSGSRLFVQGSTGGAGLRGLEHEEPTPIELSVLYFSRATHRLQGWDDLRLGGLGLTSAQIERTLEPHPDRAITPPPPSPAPSPTSPFPTEWPATSPSPTPSGSRSEEPR
ncbi:metallophosphoesterase family protein [Spirillospora albida]|uniref:metallophosphoesterase family protein n=1 Tax=Spirillospora albida TaxID=58123 RepID=UPI001FE066E8|nr:metallophosphoesterase [Spirillospora albida]